MKSSCLIVLAIIAFVKGGLGSSIVPGALWTDTNGNVIQAHGAGFLKHNGYFYWFGEDKTENSHLFRAVKAYRSKDLVQWEFVGNALSANDTGSTEVGPESVVERPKVIYNALTSKFVLWFHLDTSNYGLAKLGVAVSDTIEGPYKFNKGIRPFDADSRDMTVWVDDDGTGYVIYATQVNLNTIIARLTPDYLDIESKVHEFEGVRWEAYAMFKTNGLYYLVTSGTTGWDSNSNHYTYSRYLNSSWAPAQPIAPDSSNTFNSQSNNVIKVNDDTFIFTADRWFSSRLGDSRYIWQPIEFLENNAIKISWRPEWWIDAESGQYRNANSILMEGEDSAMATINGGAQIVYCSTCSQGMAVGWIGFNGTIEFNQIRSAANSTHSVIVSYANGDSSSRQAVISVNGNDFLTVTFPPSQNGQSVSLLVFQVPLIEGVNTLKFSNPTGWVPDLDYVAIECYYEFCGN